MSLEKTFTLLQPNMLYHLPYLSIHNYFSTFVTHSSYTIEVLDTDTLYIYLSRIPIIYGVVFRLTLVTLQTPTLTPPSNLTVHRNGVIFDISDSPSYCSPNKKKNISPEWSHNNEDDDEFGSERLRIDDNSVSESPRCFHVTRTHKTKVTSHISIIDGSP